MTYTIEEITDIRASWPRLGPLFKTLHEYHEPILGDIELLPDWSERQRDHLSEMPESLVLLAKSDDADVGMLCGRIARGIMERLTCGWISDAYVVAEHRRSGVATLLVDRFREWSRANGADQLRLQVAVANEGGVVFWTGAGFEPLYCNMKARIG